MIKYNIKEDIKNHPLDCKWARLCGAPIYSNHLCTVVDNHREVCNGKYTHECSTLLLHLTPTIRRYVRGSVFRDFYYVGVWSDAAIPTYTNWEYTLEEITKEDAINTLFEVLYNVEPLLQSRTLAGGSSDEILDEHNTYDGNYVLNDENDYRIVRRGDKITFSKVENDILTEIYSGTLDVERFKRAVIKYKAKADICCHVDKYLAEGDLISKIQAFEKL